MILFSLLCAFSYLCLSISDDDVGLTDEELVEEWRKEDEKLLKYLENPPSNCDAYIERILEKERIAQESCDPSKGSCPKVCTFEGKDRDLVTGLVHADNIDTLRNCTVIEGSITISDDTFFGWQVYTEEYDRGRLIPPMDPERLEVLSSVKVITGFLNVNGYHEDFKSLDKALGNLEVIGGQKLTLLFSSLYIAGTSLNALGLRSLRKVCSIGTNIWSNPDLCYVPTDEAWAEIRTDKTNTGPFWLGNEQCVEKGQVCDENCSDLGCWGPGEQMCFNVPAEDSLIATVK